MTQLVQLYPTLHITHHQMMLITFTDENTSLLWSILNVQAKRGLITLDSSLQESYVKLLEEGKKLAITYNTFILQFQTIAGQKDFSIGITRSLTRLKSVFVTFRKDYTVGYRANAVGSKSWNDFVSPMWPDVRNNIVNYGKNGEFEF